jgi:hypothetical protein
VRAGKRIVLACGGTTRASALTEGGSRCECECVAGAAVPACVHNQFLWNAHAVLKFLKTRRPAVEARASQSHSAWPSCARPPAAFLRGVGASDSAPPPFFRFMPPPAARLGAIACWQREATVGSSDD